MKKMVVTFLILLFIAPWFSSASALYMADIAYDYEDHGSGNFTFTFTVNNTSDGTSTGPLDFFMIDFDADSDISLYGNLTWVDNNGWDAWTEEYDPSFGGIPAASFADDSILYGSGVGIAQGESLGGFSVNFVYSGTLFPEEQLFSWYANFGTSDTDNEGILIDFDGFPDSGDEYWILGEAFGTTRHVPSGPPLTIPEPSTFVLFASLICCIFYKKRDNKDCPSISIAK